MAKKRGEGDSFEAINKLILKTAVDKRVEQILSKAFISEKEVYDLVRGFFKKFLNIEYEFTREELIKELKKIYISAPLQEKIDKLFIEVSRMEYLSAPLERPILEKILADFKSDVGELIVSHYQTDGFLKKFKDYLHKIFTHIFTRKHRKILQRDDDVLSEKERTIVKMNMLLDNAKRWSDGNIPEAKNAYKDLITLYNSLDDARKKAYFPPVNELFELIKSKER